MGTWYPEERLAPLEMAECSVSGIYLTLNITSF
jgi:hypothetical protein